MGSKVYSGAKDIYDMGKGIFDFAKDLTGEDGTLSKGVSFIKDTFMKRGEAVS